jgi:chromate transporter
LAQSASRPSASPRNPALREVARVFLKLGTIGFGGPAAHIALMRDEVVERRRWIDDQGFLDLVGACNLIPGPNSTELAIHLGRRRAGRAGLIVAGVCFILPAALIVAVLAWAYVRYGTLPVAGDLLWGVKAVMIAIVFAAVVGLGRTASRGISTCVITLGAFGLYLAGVNELAVLFGGALLLTGARSIGATFMVAAVPDLWRIGAAFLKVGALLYGSGYVLLAFLQNDLVRTHGWLTEQQLLDAVSIGQVTPGPVFTTALFVGYVLAGWDGAAIATAAIFLPSFVFVALTHGLIDKIRTSAWAGAALDGVNAAAVGLLGGVLVVLARSVFEDLWAIPIAVTASIVMLVTKVNTVWLVAAGALIGLLRTLLS